MTSGFPGMYREFRHLDRKNSRFCVRSAQNRLFFRRKGELGETKKHPPRMARVVRLVSLRRLSNFFDSLKARFLCCGGQCSPSDDMNRLGIAPRAEIPTSE